MKTLSPFVRNESSKQCCTWFPGVLLLILMKRHVQQRSSARDSRGVSGGNHG